MSWRGFMIAGLLILLSFGGTMAQAQEKSLALNEKPFALWLTEVKTEALSKGIPQSLIDTAFQNITPNETVVKLDRKQPEDKITFTKYSTGVLNPQRIARGKKLMKEHAGLLKKISDKYKVQPQIIVALWGIETEFGANKGNFSLIQSLTTLAYEGRRADFFREELFNALKIMQNEKVMANSLTGSWAGAMGHCQFMPSTYLKYAVDWNKDGHRDIWNSVPDALASIANYLHGIGWNNARSWGVKVKLPADFKDAEADLYAPQPIKHWTARGVTLANGKPLPAKAYAKSYVMYPGKPEEGAWLVYENYHHLLEWNRSRYFAHAVGMLSDALVD
jgi:membrane-bound lytic murein transglycosylase B